MLRSTSGPFLLAALALAACAAPARAQVARIDDYDEAVAAGSQTTYTDLLRQLFPDLADGPADSDGPVARTSIPLKHLFGDSPRNVYRGAMTISGVERVRVAHDARLWLLVHARGEMFDWGEIAVLALFRPGPDAQLLDAADVQADRFASLWGASPAVAVGPRRSAVVVASSHHNSSQGYLLLSLVALEGDRLRPVFQLPTLLNSNGCGDLITQTPSIDALRSAVRAGRYDLLVSVKLVKEPDPAECDPRTRGYTRRYRARLVWNSVRRRYETRGGDLGRLSRFNEKRF